MSRTSQHYNVPSSSSPYRVWESALDWCMVISAVSHLTEGVFVKLKELSSAERKKTYIVKRR